MHVFKILFLVWTKQAISSHLPSFLLTNFCLTSQCKAFGSQTANFLNKTIKPCDDFYEFACGGWISKTTKPNSEPIWNLWEENRHKRNKRLQALMDIPLEKDDLVLMKVHQVFKACMKQAEKNSISQLKKLLKKLGEWQGIKKLEVEEWIGRIVLATKLFSVHPVLKIFPQIDYKNSSNFILYLEPGNFNLPKSILTEHNHYSKEISQYKVWILKTIQYVYKNYVNISIDAAVLDIVNLEIKLAKLSLLANKHHRINLQQLHEKTGINWLKILQKFLPGRNFQATDFVVVNSLQYLTQFIGILKSTPGNVIGNYITWSVIKDLSRDTTSFMRHLNFVMDKSILGVISDMPRSQECLNKVDQHLALAVVPKYVNLFTQQDLLFKVEEMVHNIKLEFVDMLQENKWMSAETKKLAVEKIMSLKSRVGFPKWVLNKTMLNHYYKELKVNDNHFLNMLRLKAFAMQKEFQKLNSRVTDVLWPSSPLDINAYYSILQNAIVIPLGILEPPFFNPELSQVFNYGALGTLIGHELSHALDTTGRKLDKNGQLKKWWHNSDLDAYHKRTVCFEQEYNSLGVNGAITMSENIADNVGLHLSFKAYKNLREKALNKIVPHLESFTKEQLFFISYAQLWCEIGTSNDILNDGEHSPVKQRVLGALQNSRDFKVSFQCRDNITECVFW